MMDGNAIAGMISVVVPVFNREKTIRRCIDSILSSSYKNIELVIMDDGSTDGSWDIIQSYQDQRIKAYHAPNRGASAARNAGLKHATGEYVCFVDSDDYITQDIYSLCMKVITQYHPDILMFDLGVQFESTGEKYDSLAKAIPQDVVLDRGYILNTILPVLANLDPRKEYFIEDFSFNMLYKRQIVIENQVWFDETRRRWEDRIFKLQFLKYAQTFYYISKIGYYYVLGNSCFSTKYDPIVFQFILDANRDYKNIVGDVILEPYNFESSYTNNYYCRRFNETALLQFTIPDINEKMLQKDLTDALLSDRGQELFSRFQATNSFEKAIKSEVLAHRANTVFELYKNEYTSRERKKQKKVTRDNSIMYKALNIIKMLIKSLNFR